MSPEQIQLSTFEGLRRRRGWTRTGTFGSVAVAARFIAGTHCPWRPADPIAVRTCVDSATAFEATINDDTGEDIVALDRSDTAAHLALLNRAADLAIVWTIDVAHDVRWCLGRLGQLAAQAPVGPRDDLDFSVAFVDQDDRAFMWRAPAIHPMQIRENAYQRRVLAAGRADLADPLTARTEALEHYFVHSESSPEPMLEPDYEPVSGHRWAGVRMNHLIDSFYLFRLLVRYEARASGEVPDSLRIDLSGALTKRLHNGPPETMGWLVEWLEAKIVDLGRRVATHNEQSVANPNGENRVIFFVKGGRALNYYLGTPERGENDWDTQIVIDPSLAPGVWYQTFALVHDDILRALRTYNAEFTELVEANAAAFAVYLGDLAGEGLDAEEADDEEIDENEVSDVESRPHRASCKAELIDIGLPRRDSAAAIEEWKHLSHAGALLGRRGVIVPDRPYYVNEYLMMLREAFLPGADLHKVTKRVERLRRLLDSPDPVVRDGPTRLHALPRTWAAIDSLDDVARKELLAVVMEQFGVAYSLTQDADLASAFDGLAAQRVHGPSAAPPPEIAQVLAGLTDGTRVLFSDVGMAAELSGCMIRHTQLRGDLIEKNAPAFESVLRGVVDAAQPAIELFGGQAAVTGSFAAVLHARWQSAALDRFEPVRRILVELQFVSETTTETSVMEAVRARVSEVISASVLGLVVLQLDQRADPAGRSLSVGWPEEIDFDGGVAYRPQVLKVRARKVEAARLPTLVSINDLPVLGLRGLASGYLHKTAKTDESGRRAVLSAATSALLEMMSEFDERPDVAAHDAALE